MVTIPYSHVTSPKCGYIKLPFYSILNFKLSYRKSYNCLAIHFNECKYASKSL